MQTNSSEFAAGIFRSLNLIFIALAMGQVIVFCIFFNMKQNNPEWHYVLQYVAAASVIGAIVAAPWLYMRLLAGYRGANLPFDKKMQAYLNANIVKLALLEGSALFCLVCLFLVGELYYAYLFLAVFFSFLLNRPKPVKCVSDLQLTDEERLYLEQ